jgi:rod shape determining protein RodA
MIYPSYILVILLLIVVLFLPEIKGSHRWIALGFANVQPSEIAKLTLILALSKSLSKQHLTGFQIFGRVALLTLPIAALIIIEPDLGTTLTVLFISIVILAVSELPLIYLLILISPFVSVITSFSIYLFIFFILVLIYILLRSRLSKLYLGFVAAINIFLFFLTPIFWNSLKTYQQNRILTFINPMHDPFGSGYQIIQSRIAIGSGSFLGKGFLQGTQKNMHFLPEHHTDFIFSVIGEEFGFFGCLILLLLFFLFLIRVAKHIRGLKWKEFRYASVGILAYLSFQIFVNIGMNIGIVPTTGIPLPLISYGGSNLLINVLSVGFILKFVNEKSIFN